MKRAFRSGAAGFTIIELIIVIVIIGVLASVAVVAYNNVSKSARDNAVLSDLDAIASEVARYSTKNAGYTDEDIAWYSGEESNANIIFTPSSGNVVDVVANGSDYCIRVYNAGALHHDNIFKAATKGSDDATCDSLPPSADAIIGSPVSGGGWRSISAGQSFTCGVGSDSLAYCWGANTYGMLGDGGTTQSVVPKPVDTSDALSGKRIIAMTPTSGVYHTCVIATDKQGYCWSSNTNGQLGDGTTTSSLVPVAVDTSGVLDGKSLKYMSAGAYHTCAIASDNLAYCWGQNTSGKLGNNSTTSSSVPVAVYTAGVLAGKTIKAISAGGSQTCAIASDERAYCWGVGTNGNLGRNSTTSSSVPVAVDTSGVLAGKTIKAISSGDRTTCVIASDGKGYCWGYNGNGQLGNNSTTQSLVPVAVDMTGVLAGKTLKSISVGNYSSGNVCALASDNKMYCWGVNTYGHIGNNSTTQSLVPVAVDTSGVMNGKSIRSISTMNAHNCAVSTDNQGFCWGSNSNGRLGNGLTTASYVPVRVNNP